MIHFEPAITPELQQQVATLATTIWHEHYLPIIGAEQVAYMLDRFQSAPAIAQQIAAGYQYFLVREGQPYPPVDGHLIARNLGYLAFCEQPLGQALFLSKIYLLHQHRGQGLGYQMFNFVVQTARQLRLSEVYLTVNKHNTLAIARYEQWGFHKAEAIVTEIGDGFVMDDWRMVFPTHGNQKCD